MKDLIQMVLHHPDFNADEVDHDMHERLMRAIEEGDIEVLTCGRRVIDRRTTLLSSARCQKC